MNVNRRMFLSGLALVGLATGRADAAALDPTLPIFTAQSQGDVTLTGGNYQFDLGTNAPSLVYLNGPVFTTVATGFVYNGINVFDFHSLNIGAGANISVLQSSASGPIALLSSTSLNLAGSIDVSGGQFGPNFNQLGGPGAGNTAVGGDGNSIRQPGVFGQGAFALSGGGGGGFGGIGRQGDNVTYFPVFGSTQTATLAGGAGGGQYESLADRLQGGSRGGFGAGASGFGTPTQGGTPGMGGGAIELGAVQTLSVSGMITANGSNGYNLGLSGTTAGGGGGSGGGVFLHGNSVNLSGTITAQGGLGGPSNNSVAYGGAGSGGLVLAQYAGSPYGTFSNTGTVNVGSGATIGRFDVQTVPEPSSLILLGMSALGGAAAMGLRRRRRRG